MDHENGVKLARDASVTIGLTLLPGPSATIAEVMKLGLKALGGTGTDRFREAMQQEVEGAVFTLLPEVLRRVEKLEQNGAPINTNDVGRIVEQFARTWSTAADAKKRKLLEDAFLRSFDRELYESGLLNALWDRLDRLSYGDLTLLKELGEVPQGGSGGVQEKYELSNGRALGRFHAANLLREGLCWSPAHQSDPGGAGITELGLRMHQLALSTTEGPAGQ